MSPTSYQAALPRVIPSLLSATLIIIPYSNGFVNRVRKVFLQRKQRMKTRLLTFFPESQQARQFTPLREGRRPCPHQHCSRSCYFNSRPSARGDRIFSVLAGILVYFNSRPSARGDSPPPSPPRWTPYFNSRPSARGDARCPRMKKEPDVISIHAPPRGATRPVFDGDCRAVHFNSRPSARGDGAAFSPRCRGTNFNSRPSARGDAG